MASPKYWLKAIVTGLVWYPETKNSTLPDPDALFAALP